MNSFIASIKEYLNTPTAIDLYSPARVWLENHGVNLDDTSDITAISDSIFISNMSTTTNRVLLNQLGITHILSVVSSMTPLYPEDFIYKHVIAYDLPDFNLSAEFLESARYIQKAISEGGKILVHCVKGASRSVSIVLAYLIYVNFNNMNATELLEYVKFTCKRTVAKPNIGFLQQLIIFDNNTNGRNNSPNFC